MQPLQTPITNIILHYLTFNVVQRGWIGQTVLIIADINIRIGTDGYYPIPPLCPCPKITHMLEEIFLCLIIIVKYLCERGRRFQPIGQKRRIYNNPMHLFRLFCYLFSATCSNTRLYRTTTTLFIQSSTIVINGTILICLLRVNNICGNECSLATIWHILSWGFCQGEQNE